MGTRHKVVLRGVLRGAVAAAFAFPLYWVLVTAFNTRLGIFSLPPRFLPAMHFGAFLDVLAHTHWFHYIANTVLVAGVTVGLVLFTSALAGYALAELEFPGRDLAFLLILAVMMLPAQALLVPQYVVLFHLHLLNTYAAQIVPFAASTFGVVLFRQYFKSIPQDYREAARLEGAGHLTYLWRVAVPLAKPAVMTVALLTFITAWNQFQWPLIVTDSRSVQPIEVALSHYMQTYEANWRHLLSAVILALAPVVLLFFALQRHLVEGVAGKDAGLKG
ncbi:MAG: carbohydrate ABC transporter permease [Thermaerobacter sp.]|nr:carbohydrate ABC transporter permease [Thermaerobacter sp.]